MERKKPNLSPNRRLKYGTTILATAQVVDIKPVQDRFDGFAGVHHTYSDAQRKVDEAEIQLRTVQGRLEELDLEQQNAIEALALCLINNGQQREKPFAAYGTDPPGRMKDMPYADEAHAIHTLAARVLADKALSPPTHEAAQRAETAAQAMETALAPLEALRNTLSAARELRDQLAPAWDDSLDILRRGAAAATDAGALGLYTSLFGRQRRRRGKKTKPAKEQSPATTVPPDTQTAAAAIEAAE